MTELLHEYVKAAENTRQQRENDDESIANVGYIKW